MKLELFKRDSCRYCVKVFMAMEELGVEDQVEMLDVSKDTGALKRLVEVGGKQQVPCLFIDGKPLYESDDIISWMEENL